MRYSFLSFDPVTLKHVMLCSQSLIYLIAFSSLYWQIPGLYGENGLIPVAPKLECDSNIWQCPLPVLVSLHRHLNLVPSRAFQLLCLIGMLFSFITACCRRSRNAATYFLLYVLYLNAQQAGGIFLWYQWDTLLLESGFLMAVLAAFSDSSLDKISIFLINWLMTRLMFASGVVKLQSGCPAWWSLSDGKMFTAACLELALLSEPICIRSLDIHYESQCIPTPFAWYFHHMPGWFRRLSTSLTFYIEIYLPIAFLLPLSLLRKSFFFFHGHLCFPFHLFGFRHHFLFSVLLMVLIILTGNYNFFNVLIIVICLPMLERGGHVAWFPSWLDAVLSIAVGIVLTIHYMYWFNVKFDVTQLQITTEIAFERSQLDELVTKATLFLIFLGIFMFVLTVIAALYKYWSASDGLTRRKKLLHTAFILSLGVPLFSISIVPFTVIDRGIYDSVPELLKNLYQEIDPYQITNSYGLFRTMTGLNGRPEVIVEGATNPDGPWTEFVFYSKPGNVSEAPVFVLPHQPRLDWQMWFAALGSYRYNPFFLSLTYHLMENTTDVLRLMGKPQPFKETPSYVRAQLYHYRYTPFNEKVKWWKREIQYEYMPAFPRQDELLVNYLQRNGLLLTKKYISTGILDEYLAKMHEMIYAMDQARFVWSILFGAIVIIASISLSGFVPALA